MGAMRGRRNMRVVVITTHHRACGKPCGDGRNASRSTQGHAVAGLPGRAPHKARHVGGRSTLASTTGHSTAQHVATQRNMLQHSATCCNTAQHVATQRKPPSRVFPQPATKQQGTARCKIVRWSLIGVRRQHVQMRRGRVSVQMWQGRRAQWLHCSSACSTSLRTSSGSTFEPEPRTNQQQIRRCGAIA